MQILRLTTPGLEKTGLEKTGLEKTPGAPFFNPSDVDLLLGAPFAQNDRGRVWVAISHTAEAVPCYKTGEHRGSQPCAMKPCMDGNPGVLVFGKAGCQAAEVASSATSTLGVCFSLTSVFAGSGALWISMVPLRTAPSSTQTR